MAELLLSIRKTEAALGDRDKELRMDPGEYDNWRVRAKDALSYMVDEYRALKGWVKERHHDVKGEASGNIAAGMGLMKKGLDRVRLLEELYDVTLEYLLEDNEETYSRVEEVIRKLGGGEVLDDRGEERDAS